MSSAGLTGEPHLLSSERSDNIADSAGFVKGCLKKYEKTQHNSDE